MVYKAYVHEGQVVLENGAALPEGAELRIEVLPSVSAADTGEGPTLLERLRPIVGQGKGLPPDAARNLDHYLYGHPKQ